MPGPISAPKSGERKKENNINKIKAVAWAVTHSWNDECFILLFFVCGRSNRSVSASSCCILVFSEQHKWPSFVVVVGSEACRVCQHTLLSAHTQVLSALRQKSQKPAPWQRSMKLNNCLQACFIQPEAFFPGICAAQQEG